MRSILLARPGRSVTYEESWSFSNSSSRDWWRNTIVSLRGRARPEIQVPIHTDAADLWLALLRGAGVKVVLPEYARPLDVGG